MRADQTSIWYSRAGHQQIKIRLDHYNALTTTTKREYVRVVWRIREQSRPPGIF